MRDSRASSSNGAKVTVSPSMQVTTIHRKQVFLGPEQHRVNTGLVQGPEQHYGGDVLSSLLMLNVAPSDAELHAMPCGGAA